MSLLLSPTATVTDAAEQRLRKHIAIAAAAIVDALLPASTTKTRRAQVLDTLTKRLT